MRLTIRGAVLFVALGLATSTLAGYRFDWSPAEIDCAGSIGIDLASAPPRPTDQHFVRHLTWLSDLVIYGVVTEVKHDITGVYSTIATIQILSVKKGTPPDGGVLYLNLESGPSYYAPRGVMAEHITPGEPGISANQTVLLFLTTSYLQSGTTPNPFALAPSHYRLVDEGKWLVVGTQARFQDLSQTVLSMSWINSEITLTVSKQSALCQ